MKNNDYVLYLDLDGVLVDFNSGYRKLFSKGIKETQESEGEKAAREKYLAAGSTFWAELDWIQGGQELWNAAKGLFERVCILSSAGTTDPVRGQLVEVGKRLWLKKNMPEMSASDVFIVLGKHEKKKHAAKDAILVDDVRVTIDDWNKAGGYGILHNSKYFKTTIETLGDVARPLNLMEIVKRIKH